MKYGSKANLSTKSCSDFSELVGKLEIAQNAKRCSKRKKLLEIREVAKKVAEQLVESPSWPYKEIPPKRRALIFLSMQKVERFIVLVF